LELDFQLFKRFNLIQKKRNEASYDLFRNEKGGLLRDPYCGNMTQLQKLTFLRKVSVFFLN